MKMKPSLIIGGLLAGTLLSACGQIRVPGAGDPEPAPVELATPTETPEPSAPEPEAEIETASVAGPATRTVTIDWNAARTDFSSQDSDLVTPQGAGDIAVPILLPEMPVTIASDGPPPLRFSKVPDGYFAVVKGEVYDVIINGSDKLVAAPEGMVATAPEEMRFEDTMTGSQIAFNRYGASYLVEFACKAPVRTQSCITEVEAVQAVEDLLLAGTQ